MMPIVVFNFIDEPALKLNLDPRQKTKPTRRTSQTL